jgi:hypothetical protein
MSGLQCVKEVSRADTGYWRQIIFESVTENCVEEVKRPALTGNFPAETLTFKVYPADEPPILGSLFDLDSSPVREINVNSDGYFTVRANEAATATGYAWENPSKEDLQKLQCVTLVDDNYGKMKTGYIQYLFQAKVVNSFCTDKIHVPRSRSWLSEEGNSCPNNEKTCSDTITIQVSTIKAADPTKTVVSIINEGDSAEVIAAKNLCQENDQEQWNVNTDVCESKCNDPNRPWYNTDN